MTGAKGSKDPQGAELDDWFGVLDDAPTPAPQAIPSPDLSRKATPVVVQTVPPDAIPSQPRAEEDLWEWDLSPSTATASPAPSTKSSSSTLSFSPSETAAALAASTQASRPTVHVPPISDVGEVLEAEPEDDRAAPAEAPGVIDAFIDFGWDPAPGDAPAPAAAPPPDPSYSAQLGAITTAVLRGSRPPPNPTAPGIPSAIAVSRRPPPATMMFGLPGEAARKPTPSVPVPAYQPSSETPSVKRISAIPPMAEPAPSASQDLDDLVLVRSPTLDALTTPPPASPLPLAPTPAPPVTPHGLQRAPTPLRPPLPLSSLRAPTPVVNPLVVPEPSVTSRAPTPISIPGSAAPTPQGFRAPPPRQSARARAPVSIPPPPSALTRTPQPPRPSPGSAALPPLPPPPSRQFAPPPSPDSSASEGPSRPTGATLAGIPSAKAQGAMTPAISPPRPPAELDYEDSDSWATPVRRAPLAVSAPTPTVEAPRRQHKPTPVVSTEIPQDAIPTPLVPPEPITNSAGELSARREMRERFELNDFNGALGLAQSLVEIDPHDGEARRVAEQCRQRLRAIYVGRLGSLDQVPVMMVAQNELRWLTLDHRAGFVISLVDGVSSIDDIIDVSTMPQLEVLRTLYVLLTQNVITLRKPRR